MGHQKGNFLIAIGYFGKIPMTINGQYRGKIRQMAETRRDYTPISRSNRDEDIVRHSKELESRSDSSGIKKQSA